MQAERRTKYTLYIFYPKAKLILSKDNASREENKINVVYFLVSCSFLRERSMSHTPATVNGMLRI